MNSLVAPAANSNAGAKDRSAALNFPWGKRTEMIVKASAARLLTLQTMRHNFAGAARSHATCRKVSFGSTIDSATAYLSRPSARSSC